MPNRQERRGKDMLAQMLLPEQPLEDIALGKVWWESAEWNTRVFTTFRNMICTLALNRFRWINLPETCDAEFLEKILLFNGIASIAYPKKQKGIFYSTKIAPQENLNIYWRPTKWEAIGDNGLQFKASYKTGTAVYDNQMRFPVLETIDIFARELADITRTRQINRFHQRIPMILTGDQDKELDMTNIAKQVGGGEPLIVGFDSMNDIEYKALTQKPAPFIGLELTEQEKLIWQQVYDFLGIPSVAFKNERQITADVEIQQETTHVMRLDGLRERRKACQELNRKFYYPNALYPKLLEKPIYVVKAEDYESAEWNERHYPEEEEGSTENV